jgi:hypothetical protein
MTHEAIKQILEKYWACETSPEEESLLADFLLSSEVPEELKKYRALFAWKKQQVQIVGSKKLKAGFESPRSVRFYPLVKIAASILLILTAGVGFYTHYEQERFMDAVFSETYSDPEEALKATENVIEKVSSVLQLVKDKTVDSQTTDSLEVKVIETVE